jgi:hypothetical protein
MKTLLPTLAALSLIASIFPESAQQYKYETPIAPGVAVPDEVDSSIGTLICPTAIPTVQLSRKSTTTWMRRVAKGCLLPIN